MIAIKKKTKKKPVTKKKRAVKKKTTVKTKKKKGKRVPVKPKLSEQFLKIVKELDKAVHELNRGAFDDAKAKFKEIVDKYPEERALRERAAMYMRICEKSAGKHQQRLKDPDEFFNVGVFHLNNEEYDEAIKYFEKALSFDAKNDKVQYEMAAAHALKGNREESLNFLKTAIKLKPQNRIRAKMDADFDSLRTDAEFISFIEPGDEEID